MAENNNILEKLDGLEARYEEVSTLITDPSVIADQQRYVKLTKEYKEIRCTVLRLISGMETSPEWKKKEETTSTSRMT